LSEEISSKQAVAAAREAEIEASRAMYLPVATHATILFFKLARLSELNQLYQFSLPWFLKIYSKALEVEKGEEEEPIDDRLQVLSAHLTRKVFEVVSPAVFDQHTPIIAFLLWLAQLEAKVGLTTRGALRYFVICFNMVLGWLGHERLASCVIWTKSVVNP
jgi:dynein heavy chain, axonemal